jgi:hypothetical protein
MAMTSTIEEFTYGGRNWKRIHAPKPDEAFIMGVDLGQSQDPTALAVMRATRTPLQTWSVNQLACTTRQDVQERFDVLHAERLPLGTGYPEIVEYVSELLMRPPLRTACYLVIDESGVGRAVGDMFDRAGLKAVRVNITAGIDVSQPDITNPRRWSVAKTLLISGVDARLHTGGLRFAAALSEATTLAEELKDFRRHLTAAGRATYQARVGKHDDLVLAVAIALWWAEERRKHWSTTGYVRGLY